MGYIDYGCNVLGVNEFVDAVPSFCAQESISGLFRLVWLGESRSVVCWNGCIDLLSVIVYYYRGNMSVCWQGCTYAQVPNPVLCLSWP